MMVIRPPQHEQGGGLPVSVASLVLSSLDVLLLDVTPLSLGIETLGGVFTRLIDRKAKRIAWHSQQSAAKRELLGAMAVGEQAVMANAMEAARQHVEQESALELARVEAHVRHMGNGSVELYHPLMILAEADQSEPVTSHSDE